MSFLQKMQRCCPDTILGCFRGLMLHFNKKSPMKKKKEAASIHHLQEEQFEFTPAKLGNQEEVQTKMKEARELKQAKKEVEEHEQNLAMKINLKQIHEGEVEEKSNLLVRETEELPTIKAFKFKNNLEPYDPYFATIDEKTRNLQLFFKQPAKIILTHADKSMVNIKEIQTLSGFKMIISYRLPCSYSYYCQINKNLQIVASLNGVITGFNIEEVIHANLTVNSLHFKKFMLLEPRYFRYIKYYNSSEGSHWEVCTSVKGRPESEANEKECELTSISCFEEHAEGLIANVYMEVDLKSNIKASKVVQRVYQQVGNYLDNLYLYAKENYREETV